MKKNVLLAIVCIYVSQIYGQQKGPSGSTKTDSLSKAIPSKFFNKLVRRDFAGLMGFNDNAINQIFVDITDPKVELSYIVPTTKEKRPTFWLGGTLKTELNDNKFTDIFGEKGFQSNLEFGGKIVVDFFSPTFTKYSRYFFKNDEKRVLLRNKIEALKLALQLKKNNAEAELSKVKEQLRSNPTNLSNITIQDSLLEIIDETDKNIDKEIFETIKKSKWTQKRYLWLVIDGSLGVARVNTLINRNALSYDDGFKKKNYGSRILAVSINKAIVKYNREFFPVYNYYLKFEVNRANSLFDGDMVNIIEDYPYYNSTGFTRLIRKSKDAYDLTNPNVDTSYATKKIISAGFAGFFTEKRNFGVLANISRNLSNKVSGGEIGLIIPAFKKKDDEVTKFNILLTLGFIDLFRNDPDNITTSLWARRYINLKFSLPIGLPE